MHGKKYPKSKDQIIASFKGCALNIKTDGSEDDLIHCFKEDQPCSTGKEILKDQTRLLRDDSLHENPFSPTDSDVEDANASFNSLMKTVMRMILFLSSKNVTCVKEKSTKI